MKFSSTLFVTGIFSVIGLASASAIGTRQSCPQASRFGDLTISPTNTAFNGGDSITVNVDLTCAINHFGIVPSYLDYTIEVPASSNNGHEPPILLARRNYVSGSTSDMFTTQIPYGYYFAGAVNTVVLTNTYAINGTNGDKVYVQGGVSTGITINPSV
ncbi:hypothetical protein H0H81_003554 [Sphagnurus paluster]|uniref:Uncharacterized protein n=1 Tax=Sphagnurus paluster TaxID=117069 RepID=A0A9P7FV78_9AGAR|nr:hypothetical protein H0H81_003554 [Sphagnurus paluster]